MNSTFDVGGLLHLEMQDYKANMVRLKRMRERRPKDSDLERAKALFEKIRLGIGLARAHWNRSKLHWVVLDDTNRFEKKVTAELQLGKTGVWRERDERKEFSKLSGEIAPAKDSSEMKKWRHQIDPMYDERVFLMPDSARIECADAGLPQLGDAAGLLPDAKDEKSYFVLPGPGSDELASEAYSIIGDINRIVDASFAAEKMENESHTQDCSPEFENSDPIVEKRTAAVKLDGLVVSDLAESGHSS